MRSLRRSDRGLSEIVGTLMLVLIVVSAATLLAAFIATYQKQVQTEQAYQHDQSLESIHVLSLGTILNSTGTGFANLSFTLASASVDSSVITGITLNNEPLLHFNWTNPDNGSSGNISLPHDLSLPAFQELIITTDLNDNLHNAKNYSFVTRPTPNEYLKFDIYTAYQNDFSRVFLPPVPLAVVSEINPSGNNPITLLDGSTSFQPGSNVSIVDWGWTVSEGGVLSSGTSLGTFMQGGVAVANGALSNGVVDGAGATATFTVPSTFAWGPTDSVVFTLGSGNNLTVSGGGGGCTLSGSAISAGASPSLSGTTLTVTFSFTTTISGCATPSSATLALAAAGVALTPDPFLPLSATGEEYEVSPALPAIGDPSIPYAVTLVVTNSDGLVGTSTVQYVPID
jgi:flagellin-like protein